MQAALQHGQAGIGVQRMRQRDDHRVQFIIVQQIGPARRIARHVKALAEQAQSPLPSPANVRDAHAIDLGDLGQMAERGDPARAQNADINH